VEAKQGFGMKRVLCIVIILENVSVKNKENNGNPKNESKQAEN
jgi:hypothetical protein